MLTSLGKFLRKLRIDNNELLKDMAQKLNVSVSFLSAVENGKKGGRPAKQIDMDQVFDLLNQGKTYQQIADVMGVSRNTIANRIQEHKKQKPETKTNK